MNRLFPQVDPAQWMPGFADPAAWQTWNAMPQFDPKPLLDTINGLGATLDPQKLAELQGEYLQQMGTLWQDLMVGKAAPVADRRFSAPEWQSTPLHAFNAAAYLLNARLLTSLAEAVEATPKAKQKIRFAVQQIVDAMSPANFLATNPEAQQKLLDTKGESLMKGITHLLEDMRKGHISQTDENAFEVGRNLATTEGAVIFENALFQLIQYKPLTATVRERPLLMVPPCINKYYILDLQPENSLVRHLVEQGHTVFLMSWCNPGVSLGHLTWDDYVEQGVLQAVEVVQQVSHQDQINLFGFCVGGTLLGTALAALAARGQQPAASVTLLTTFLDFSDPGVIGVFIDEAHVALREQTIGRGGLMPARDFISTFSSLRPNDLVWNYVSTNYLKGQEPPPFDLLFWNADGTNVPGPMHAWYLRNMYLENNLRVPGKLTVCGEKLDLSKIDAPAFLYASREDHIVPWRAAFESTRLLNPQHPERNRFVLGASGHIAGVINPPAKKKRSYWENDTPGLDADAWLQGATEHLGSWWPEWTAFLDEHAGAEKKAPRGYGNAKYKAIEPAPGRYVRVKPE